MKHKKTLLVSAVVTAVAFGMVKRNHGDLQITEKSTQITYTPDEVSPKEAIAIVGQVEATKDFSTFVYQCDRVRKIVVLFEHPNTQPKVRLILQQSEGEDQARHRYVTHSDPWSFTDAHQTVWNITAGNVTGKGGTYNGTVCVFDLNKSSQMQHDSELENVIQQYGA